MSEKSVSPRTIDSIKEGDYIAFMWSYMSVDEKHIEVAPVTSVGTNDFLVHFLYGYKSIGEFIKRDEVIAIGNLEGATKLKGWGGKFDKIA